MPAWDQLEVLIPRIYQFAFRLSERADIAEDLTQETLLRAWEKREQLHDPKALRVWMFQILCNLWRDQRRRGQRLQVRDSNLDTAIDREPLPGEILGNREQIAQLLTAMNQLPPREREVLHLSAVEELNSLEIADVLGTSVNSVKVSLSNARKKMRSLFASHQPSISSTNPQ